MLTKPLAELGVWRSEERLLLWGVVVFRKSLELQETTDFVHSGGKGNHFTILAWRTPWTEEPGGLQFTGLQRAGCDQSDLAHVPWLCSRLLPELSLVIPRKVPKGPPRRKWQPTSVFLAWRIPGTGKPGGLPSMGLHRVGHDWSDLAAAAVQKQYPGFCFSFASQILCKCSQLAPSNL